MLPFLKYDLVSSMGDDYVDEAKRKLEKTARRRAFAFGAIVGMFGGLCTALLWQFWALGSILSDSQYSFNYGFETQFHQASSAISLETVRFTGAAGFYDNGTAYVVDYPGPKYVGRPSDDIDAAWEELIKHRHFPITDEEAREAFGDKYTQYYRVPDIGYVAGLDVLHTLHCVNVVRKGLYRDYYYPDGTNDFYDYHLDHCVDIIRQSVQCQGDTTPIPVKYFKGRPDGFTDTDQVHTCRNFAELRAWASKENAERYRKVGVLVEDN